MRCALRQQFAHCCLLAAEQLWPSCGGAVAARQVICPTDQTIPARPEADQRLSAESQGPLLSTHLPRGPQLWSMDDAAVLFKAAPDLYFDTVGEVIRRTSTVHGPTPRDDFEVKQVHSSAASAQRWHNKMAGCEAMKPASHRCLQRF